MQLKYYCRSFIYLFFRIMKIQRIINISNIILFIYKAHALNLVKFALM